MLIGGLAEKDLPAIFKGSDAHAIYWQSRFLLLQRVQLGALLLAGAGAAVQWTVGNTSLGAVLAVLGFALAAVSRLQISATEPERKWYDGRAAAESAKSLAWRFAVCGAPFAKSLSNGDATGAFVEQVLQLTRDLSSLDRPTGEEVQITLAMRTLRNSTLAKRKSAYENHRLLDQQRWYSRKAEDNSDSATSWGNILLFVDIVGLAFGLAAAVGWIDFDVIGAVATLSAAGVAWVQVKQYELLACSYSVASQELSAVRDCLATVSSEREWAEFVVRAEAAISREHTLWRAGRGVKPS